MKIISIGNKIIILLTVLLAGYQIIRGMDSYSYLTTFYFTMSFGVLLLACLLLLLMGFEIIDNNFVAVISALIPITLSLGLVNDKFTQYHLTYSILLWIGFMVAIYFRLNGSAKIASLSLGFIHGVSSLVIFLLPLWSIFFNGDNMNYSFVSFGAILIGMGGVLIVSLKSRSMVLSKKKIAMFFPLLLLFTTTTLVVGLGASN